MNYQGLESEFNTILVNHPDKIKVQRSKFNYQDARARYLETETRMRQDNSRMPDGTPINLGLEILQPININDKIKFTYDTKYPVSSLTPAKTEQLIKEQLPNPKPQAKMATFEEFFRDEIKKQSELENARSLLKPTTTKIKKTILKSSPILGDSELSVVSISPDDVRIVRKRGRPAKEEQVIDINGQITDLTDPPAYRKTKKAKKLELAEQIEKQKKDKMDEDDFKKDARGSVKRSKSKNKANK